MNRREILYFVWLRVLIYGLAAMGTYSLFPFWRGDGFALLLIFHLFDVIITLIALGIMRTIFKFEPGTYSLRNRRDNIFQWGLYDSLLVAHLQFYYVNMLIPPHFRTIFLRILGLKSDKEFFLTGGMILEPHLVKIHKNVTIGYETMLSPIQITEDNLLIGNIEIGAFATIGQRCVILPNVKIGEGAFVKAMSLIMPGTIIPPYEEWGGIPAKRITEK